MAPTNPPPGTNLPPDGMLTPRGSAIEPSQSPFEDSDDANDAVGYWESYADLMEWLARSGGVITRAQQDRLRSYGFRPVGQLRSTQREVFAITAAKYNEVSYKWNDPADSYEEETTTGGVTYKNVLLFVSPFRIRDDGSWAVVEESEISHSASLTFTGGFVAWGNLRHWSWLAPRGRYMARPGARNKHGEVWYKLRQDLR